MSKSAITIDHAMPDGLPGTHPGEILREELAELGLSANVFALKLKVPTNRITEILAGRRSVSAETALRLGRFLRNQCPVLDEPSDQLRSQAGRGRIRQRYRSPNPAACGVMPSGPELVRPKQRDPG